MAGEVVDYWYDRWQGELKPDEWSSRKGVQEIQVRSRRWGTACSGSTTVDSTQLAYRTAQLELKGRLQPALTTAQSRDLSPRA